MTLFCHVAVLALALFVLSVQRLPAQVQAFSASLGGTVSDSSGGIVSGAQVSLSSPSTGTSRTFTTDSAGRYTFTLVPPGTYVLTVEHPGFNKYVQQNIALSIGQAANQDVSLTVGEVNQAVTVSAEAPLLTTDNANLAADVDQRQIQQLPLNLRNVVGLALLNSSVNNSSQ